MANTTKIYANAVASYHAGKLLGREQIKRLAEADYADAIKIITDFGYGGGVLNADKTFDIDRFIADETAKLIDYVLSDSPNEWLSRCLTDRFFFSNAKVFYKNKFTNVDLDAALYRMEGNELLKKAIDLPDYSLLTDALAEAFSALDAQFSDTKASPKTIDLILTNACYADMIFCAKKSGSKMLQKYVRAEIDLGNLNTVFRCKALEFSESLTSEMLIKGGSLSEEDLLLALKSDDAATAQLFYATDYGDALMRLAEDGKKAKFRAEADDFLFYLTNAEADNMLSLSPFVGYFTAKLAEFKAVKLILTCLKNNARAEISVRLGAVYTAIG